MNVADAIAACKAQGHPQTSLIHGLTAQCIKALSILRPGSLVPIHNPLIRGRDANVTLFLQDIAAASLADVVAGRGSVLTVISCYRAFPQQVMLRALVGHGVPMAAQPGTSNHEQAAATDVEDYLGWRPFFTRREWKEIEIGDPTHFACFLPGVRRDLAGSGVLAFQRLWNQHNAAVHLVEDGVAGPATITACLASPAAGW